MSSGPSGGARGGAAGGRNLPLGLFACFLLGVVAFAYGLFSPQPLRAWQALQVNFIYFTGLAFAGVVIAAIYTLTESRWGLRVRRLAECGVALVPLSLLAFVGVAVGHRDFAPAAQHLDHLAPSKQVWLEPSFLLARDGVALLVLALLAFAFVYYSFRVDLGAPPGGFRPKQNGLVAWLTRGFRGYEAERARAKRIQYMLAPALVLAYALVFSLLAFDQVMSLDPTWISTLFGGYVFITTMFLGWATLSAVAVVVSERKGDDALASYGAAITVDDRHDLGKIFFAFCMLSADFFWSQYVVIWYGNIPEETPFLIRRVYEMPWKPVSLAVLILCFGAPFVLLLFRRVKRTKTTLFGVGVLVMVMVWLERFLLIVPSTWVDHEGRPLGDPALPLGLIEVGVTLGFLGAAGLLYRWALGQFVVPARREHSAEALAHGGEDEAEEGAHA